MYEKKIPQNIQCPIEKGIDIFSGKWKGNIICILAQRGTLRYSEFKEEIPTITDTVLSATLKGLVADGIIAREQFPEIPPRVEYSLTSFGEEAVPIFQAIAKWTNKYIDEVLSYDIMPICEECVFRDN